MKNIFMGALAAFALVLGVAAVAKTVPQVRAGRYQACLVNVQSRDLHGRIFNRRVALILDTATGNFCYGYCSEPQSPTTAHPQGWWFQKMAGIPGELRDLDGGHRE